MLTLVHEQKASDIPTHYTLALRMRDRLGNKIKELFPDNKQLSDHFDAGCYARCLYALHDIVTNFKEHRKLSHHTRKARETLFAEMNTWVNKHSHHLKSAENK